MAARLFLDEIGELPLAAQAKLLRAIQHGEIDPVGGKKTVKVDVRIISATNRNLIDQVRQGRFREDLFYRLNVFPIGIPPLRARREDVPDLARAFLAQFAAGEKKRLRGFSADAMALITSYAWPGNVRQLENAVFRAVVLADHDEITVADLPQIAMQVSGLPPHVPAPRLDAPLPAERAPETVTVESVIRTCSSSSTSMATCAISKRWRPTSSASPSRITAAISRRWRDG